LKLTHFTALMRGLADVEITAYAPFDNAVFSVKQWYWIAAAQWTAVIDAGAIPCTPAPHCADWLLA